MCTGTPSFSASNTSRATITSSAAGVIPRRPRLVAITPSFALPPSVRLNSSQCEMTVISNVLAYCSACFIKSAFSTGRPSSLTATAPANFSSPICASSSPFCPFEIHPIGYTFTFPASFALEIMYDTSAALSIGGSVFGIQAIDVKPPIAAARVPLSMSSLYSKPGSRKCVCMSISPGATINPAASMTSISNPSGSSSVPISSIIPLLI